MKKRDVLIPFRNTCGTRELKMCIKLMKKHLKIPYDNIVIIGDKVANLEEDIKNIVIEKRKYNKWLDNNYLVSLYIQEYDKPFILFNDDFFLTQEVEEIPYYFCGTLQTRAKTTYVIDPATDELRVSSYGLNIGAFLDDVGNYANFEVHTPIIVDKPDLMQAAIQQCNQNDYPAMKRTMYIVNLVPPAEEQRSLEYDVKFGEPLKVMQYPFFSLADHKEFNAFKEDLEELAN